MVIAVGRTDLLFYNEVKDIFVIQTDTTIVQNGRLSGLKLKTEC